LGRSLARAYAEAVDHLSEAADALQGCVTFGDARTNSRASCYVVDDSRPATVYGRTIMELFGLSLAAGSNGRDFAAGV